MKSKEEIYESNGCNRRSEILDAMQEYSDQNNADLIAELKLMKNLLKQTSLIFGGEYGTGKKYSDTIGGRLIDNINRTI